MDVIFFIGITAIVLALFAYVTGRRFGVLGLALAAGYVLSKLWETSLAGWAQYLPLESGVIEPVTIVTLAIILLPSVVLLFGGPAYRTKRGRLIGSLLYGLLAVIFSLGAFEYSLVLVGSGRNLFEMLVQYQQYILTIALGVSIIDIMYARTNKGEKQTKKH